MRVYQIAEEVRFSNRVLVQLLQDRGVDVSSHMAPLSESEEALLRDLIGELRKDQPREERAPAITVVADPLPVVERAPAPTFVEPPAPPAAPELPPAPIPAKIDETPAPPAAATPAEGTPKAEKPPEAAEAAPLKPAGRRVKKLQEREVIEQSLAEMTDEHGAVPKEKEPVPAAPPPEKSKTFRFDKRAQTGRTAARRAVKLPPVPVAPSGPVEITLPVSVKDLSSALGVKVPDILRVLLQNGVKANINARLDQDTVDVIALEFGREVKVRTEVAAEEAFLTNIAEDLDRPEDLKPRAPVVAMLGHVDHGKTSLLDWIRKSDVAAHEYGGITQHVSAYRITQDKRDIVFIDLPGHEAFTEMRARGAAVTDLVILVVAADEGVMPQTQECINHAKAAEVPVIVALNKCDKREAQPQRVKQSLSSYGLIAEEWGGDTLMVETSATTGTGMKELLDAILLQAEVLEFRANPHKKAVGTVLEAEKSEGRGILATVLVQEGTLQPGDAVLAGTGFGRVRDIRDDRGRSVRAAGPSTPVEITGLSEVPEAGDRFYVVENLARAREIAEERARRLRERSLAEKQPLSLADLFKKVGEGRAKEVPIIVKGDAKGSVEAITKKLAGLATSEVEIKVLHGAVGSVNESDVQLASASQAIILGFSVIAEERARALAHERGVDIRFYQIIYELIDDVKLAMEKQLAPAERESVLGHAEVRQIFRTTRLGSIAGSFVTDGVIRRNARARLVRNGKVIYDRGVLESLRRFKDDVKEVREGFECGLKLSGYEDLKEGDVVEVYEVLEFARKLEDSARRE
ncbi:MAG: translation initiation factor IF-2 [Planctomycetes bacterium]|jgi:translation initiation factor IF-2|nr:translation initiation factor IF-2 [Planctomycetota bacterium]